MKTRPPLSIVLLFTLSFVQTSAQADPGDILQVFRLPEIPDDPFNVTGCVAVGDKVVIGAQAADAGSVVDAGAAFVFDASTGDLLHVIQNPTLRSYESFTENMAMADEQTVLISASNAGFNQPGDLHMSGAAYLFDVTTGELLMSFQRPTPAYQAYFGRSVAAANDRVLIGASGDPTGGDKAGAAYLFDMTTGDLLKTYLNPTPGGTGVPDYFGANVALAGDKVVIGARYEDTAGLTDAGAVYVFDGSTGALLQTIVSPAPHESINFGSGIAPFGSNILVDDGRFSSETPETIHLFDPATGELIQTFFDPGVEGYTYTYLGSAAKLGSNTVMAKISSFSFDPTSRVGAICLFDADTGELLDKIFDPESVEQGLFPSGLATMGSDILAGASDRQTVYLLEGITVVPEPGTLVLLASGGLGLLLGAVWSRAKKQRNRQKPCWRSR